MKPSIANGSLKKTAAKHADVYFTSYSLNACCSGTKFVISSALNRSFAQGDIIVAERPFLGWWSLIDIERKRLSCC